MNKKQISILVFVVLLLSGCARKYYHLRDSYSMDELNQFISIKYDKLNFSDLTSNELVAKRMGENIRKDLNLENSNETATLKFDELGLHHVSVLDNILILHFEYIHVNRIENPEAYYFKLAKNNFCEKKFIKKGLILKLFIHQIKFWSASTKVVSIDIDKEQCSK